LTVEGALVSLDLRGFTDLTRRFSARGREGAEEVTAVISTCFAQLVDAVEGRGGDVVAFGGDALLALFDGSSAIDCAASAAVALRDCVIGLGAVPTSLGSIRLSARIALGVGAVECYRIGERQRAVVAAGAVVSRTLDHERLAHAREVVADSELFEVAASCRRGAARGDGFVLSRAADIASCAARNVEPDDPEPYVAPSLRPWLQSGVGAGEHRELAVAFVFLRGLDGIEARSAPTAVFDALNGLAAAVERACERNTLSWVNTDAQRDGVKITLVAGLPAAGDHDAARLVRGVHELLAEVRDLDVSAGAAACRAFVGDIGNTSRRGLMVMGDGVNLAARLAARARSHRLLGDPVLVSRVPKIPRAALKPFRARGFPELIRPYRIDATTDGGRRVAPALIAKPMVLHGRRRECEVLFNALTAARRGSGAVVEIVGDPGAGKSRLLAELFERCEANEAIIVAGDPTSARVAFAALRRELHDRLGRRVARHRDLAALFEPPIANAPAITERAQRSLHEAVLAALDATPLVLIVDDAQWLDDASRALVASIATATTNRPWLVCSTRRTGGAAIPTPPTIRVQRLRLHPLPASALRAIARDASATPLATMQLDRIVDAAHGNPLFASQLAAAGRAIEQVPERIERVIAARIDSLTPEDRAHLRDAAVIGRDVRLELLATVTGEPALMRHSAWSGLAGLVVMTPTSMRFDHELVRQVAYDGLSYKRRRALHEATMHALLAEGRSERVADDLAGAIAGHAEASGHPEVAWKWSRRAAVTAAAAGAFDEAVAQYERALRASRATRSANAGLVASMLESLGDAADRAGDPTKAADGYRRARRTVDDAVASALIASKLGVLAERQGKYAAAARWFRSGLRDLGDGTRHDRARARLLLDFGSLRQYEGRYADAVALARQARALAGKRRARQLVAESELQLEMALGAVSDPASEDHFIRAERALRALGDDENLATLYVNGGSTAYEAGDWHTAETRYAAALRALERGGHPGARATVRNNQAMLLLDRGSYNAANTLLDEARRDWLALGFDYGVAVTTMNAGRIAAYTGDAAAARAHFRGARRDMARLGTSAYDAELAVFDVERLVAGRQYATAIRAVVPALALLASGDRPALAVTLVRLHGVALAGAERPDRAQQVLRDALTQARSIDARFEIAFTLDALIALDPTDARELRRERTSLAKALGIVRFPFASA
jgi:class 3 adenylate cyclase/tetratricopeptide (TPR) repeat protein